MLDFVQELASTLIFIFGFVTLVTFAVLYCICVYAVHSGKDDPTLLVNRQFDKIVNRQ